MSFNPVRSAYISGTATVATSVATRFRGFIAANYSAAVREFELKNGGTSGTILFKFAVPSGQVMMLDFGDENFYFTSGIYVSITGVSAALNLYFDP